MTQSCPNVIFSTPVSHVFEIERKCQARHGKQIESYREKQIFSTFSFRRQIISVSGELRWIFLTRLLRGESPILGNPDKEQIFFDSLLTFQKCICLILLRKKTNEGIFFAFCTNGCLALEIIWKIWNKKTKFCSLINQNTCCLNLLWIWFVTMEWKKVVKNHHDISFDVKWFYFLLQLLIFISKEMSNLKLY